MSCAVFSSIVMRESRSATLESTLAVGSLYSGLASAATKAERRRHPAERNFIVREEVGFFAGCFKVGSHVDYDDFDFPRTPLPSCIGFGISHEHVREWWEI